MNKISLPKTIIEDFKRYYAKRRMLEKKGYKFHKYYELNYDKEIK